MTTPLKPGDPHAFGRFEIVGRLGAGGMGVAYLARSEDQTWVVAKAVRLDFADDPDLRARFRREVLTLSAVESQFVPQVLASDLTADRQWVALEYLQGQTLRDKVRSGGPLPAELQVALAVGVAEGLAELHDRGLIHRDVKPDNVICTAAGPRLVDFGVARFENR